ncbi:hypothetical protein ES702_03504 [subsurface metagenome]
MKIVPYLWYFTQFKYQKSGYFLDEIYGYFLDLELFT